MKKILVCQHVAYEILGTLNPLFKQNGFRIRYVNFGRFPDQKPSLEGYDGLVILGGPMNTDQQHEFPHLSEEVKMVQKALEMDIPILGICLGAQLIAQALGAKVGRNPQREIGWKEVFLTEEGKNDPVMKHFGANEKIFHWHGDRFEIPRDALHLAYSQLCQNQAFRYGDKVYGFQFHLEVDEPMVERWLRVPDRLVELNSLSQPNDPQTILQETTQFIPRLKQLSGQTFGAFIQGFGCSKKFVRLSSKH